MALKRQYTHSNGENLSGYFRVRQVNTYYEKDHGNPMTSGCCFFLEALSGDFGSNTFKAIENSTNDESQGAKWYDFVPSTSLESGVNSLPEQAYIHLKTLDSFSNAQDC